MRDRIERLIMEAQSLVRRAGSSRDSDTRVYYRRLAKDKESQARKLYLHFCKEFGYVEIKGIR